uniref:BTB domain-containing protein n=2 Tax=Aegilops tauschii subsp. strangulata TaxID=200361 RepID=A0A453T4U5_AEGTS
GAASRESYSCGSGSVRCVLPPDGSSPSARRNLCSGEKRRRLRAAAAPWGARGSRTGPDSVMSSFAGVSVVDGDKECSCETSAVHAGADSGYHLLMVRGYPRTQEGSSTGDSITTALVYDNDDAERGLAVEAKFSFSLVDHVEKQNPMYICEASKTCTFSGSATSWGCDRFMRRDAIERSSDLKGGCFTVRCDIMVVCQDSKTEDAGRTLSGIHHHFNNLLQTKVGADVTFEVSGERFAAHRCVLAARSKVFMAQLFGPMKEGTTTSTVIQIKDMEAKVFRALLIFIYTDVFPLPLREEHRMGEDEMSVVMEEAKEAEAVQDEMRLQCLQHLFVAADRYDLQRLKFICEQQLSEHIGVTSVMSTLALAEQHHCQGLKEACFKFIQVQSPSCLQTVMSTNGWDRVYTTYPSVFKEFIANLALNQR